MEGVWLEMREGKEVLGFGCFLPKPSKKFSPQNGEKEGRGDLHMGFVLYVAFFSFFFFPFQF